MPRRGKLGNAPGDDVHLTPPEIWERVARVVDEMWFDPCPHPWTVDGLGEAPWRAGPTYVNPPFSLLYRFVMRAVEHARQGSTTVVLVPTRTSQPYWAWLSTYASDIAFWTGDKDHGGTLPRRVRYLRPDGTRQAGAPFDTALFLLSRNPGHRLAFKSAFADVATVVRAQPLWVSVL